MNPRPSVEQMQKAMEFIAVYHQNCENVDIDAYDKAVEAPEYPALKPVFPYLFTFHFPTETYGNDELEHDNPDALKTLDTPIGELVVIIEYPGADPDCYTSGLFDTTLTEEMSVADRIDEYHYQFSDGLWASKTVREVIAELTKLGMTYNREECIFGKAEDFPADEDLMVGGV